MGKGKGGGMGDRRERVKEGVSVIMWERGKEGYG